MGKIARTASLLLMPGYTPCVHCDNVLPPGKIICSGCGGYNVGRKKRVASMPGDEDAAFFLLSDVPTDDIDRINIGPVLNPLLGGEDTGYGMPPSTTMLLAGMAGAGKTTMMVQALDAIVAGLDARESTAGKNVLYVAAEQSGSELRMVADRVGVRRMDRVHIAPVRGGAFDLDTLLEDADPSMVITDSLSGLIGPTGGDADAILFCQRLKDYAVERMVPSIILSHVNKEKEVAGVYTLQHEVDAVMLAIIGDQMAPPDEPVDEKARTLHVLKNRYGRAPAKGRYTMTRRGLVPLGDSAEAAIKMARHGRNGRRRGADNDEYNDKEE